MHKRWRFKVIWPKMCEATQRHSVEKIWRGHTHVHRTTMRENTNWFFLQINILSEAKCRHTISVCMHRHTLGLASSHTRQPAKCTGIKAKKKIRENAQINYEIHRFTFNGKKTHRCSYRQLGPFRTRSFHNDPLDDNISKKNVCTIQKYFQLYRLNGLFSLNQWQMIYTEIDCEWNVFNEL